MRTRLLLASLLAAASLLPQEMAAADTAKVGPKRGSLVVVGGGPVGPAILDAFFSLAGGKDAPIVIIPTAGEADSYEPDWITKHFLAKAGATRLTMLHTRDPKVAQSKEFVAPIRNARAIWFDGGRQWRLVDSYLRTRTHREIEALLERGGVVGGSSAGATIQGSYLVRGARQGNTLMMAPGYEEGLALLRHVAVDQHLLKRNRQDDMLAVIDRYPKLLGIGIDEGTAIVVTRDHMRVVGDSKVAIYDHAYRPAEPGAKRYYFLSPGDQFDLARRRAAVTATASQD
jgi:cyanophycinase